MFSEVKWLRQFDDYLTQISLNCVHVLMRNFPNRLTNAFIFQHKIIINPPKNAENNSPKLKQCQSTYSNKIATQNSSDNENQKLARSTTQSKSNKTYRPVWKT